MKEKLDALAREDAEIKKTARKWYEQCCQEMQACASRREHCAEVTLERATRHGYDSFHEKHGPAATEAVKLLTADDSIRAWYVFKLTPAHTLSGGIYGGEERSYEETVELIMHIRW